MKHASARICLGLVTAAAALAATLGATAADANFAAYRTHVNAICRSYTPTFKRLEADMAKTKRAGNLQRYAYDFGTILGLTLAQGVRVEKTPVPADGRARMAGPLRLLHAADAHHAQDHAVHARAKAQVVADEQRQQRPWCGRWDRV